MSVGCISSLMELFSVTVLRALSLFYVFRRARGEIERHGFVNRTVGSIGNKKLVHLFRLEVATFLFNLYLTMRTSASNESIYV